MCEGITEHGGLRAHDTTFGYYGERERDGGGGDILVAGKVMLTCFAVLWRNCFAGYKVCICTS